MVDEKVHCMEVARRYEKDFWDGDRRYGYGGYVYDGRYEIIAQKLIEHYDLSEKARILDIGCGKGFFLYELKRLFPNATVRGFDISEYAIQNAKEEIRESLCVGKAEDDFSFKDNEFDFIFSIATLHNLPLPQLKHALQEMERVAKQKYLVVESYRNARELFNLQCWALTCESFFSKDEWLWLFNEFNYTGDYEFIYFE